MRRVMLNNWESHFLHNQILCPTSSNINSISRTVTSVSRYTDADRTNTFVQIANTDSFTERQSNYVRRTTNKVDMYTHVETNWILP